MSRDSKGGRGGKGPAGKGSAGKGPSGPKRPQGAGKAPFRAGPPRRDSDDAPKRFRSPRREDERSFDGPPRRDRDDAPKRFRSPRREDERSFDGSPRRGRDDAPKRFRSPRREDERSFDGSPRRGGRDDYRDDDFHADDRRAADQADDRNWLPDTDAFSADDERPMRRSAPRARGGETRAPRGDRRPSSGGFSDDQRSARRDAPPAGKRPPQGRPDRAYDAPSQERAPLEGPTRAERRAASSETLRTGVQTLTVTPDEDGMRIDRFLSARFPLVPFSHIQRIARKGELRVNGKRVETKDRLAAGQSVRVPPLEIGERPILANPRKAEGDGQYLKAITLYEDADILVLNKPAGLAVQGGSGTTRHIDGMLASLTDAEGNRPRLVHRLDKDTSGCLLVAKSRFAAAQLAKTFRSRAARKIYWAVVSGIPKPRQGRISTYLAKEQAERESHMRIARHGEDGASHAITYYAVVEQAAQKLAWLSLKPVTGRMHQLRVHTNEIGHPIIGDPKYFNRENWEIPGGIQHKLHLHARRLVVPHPRGKGTIDVSAPLPAHMEQTFNLLGWDASAYDPIIDAPED